MAISVSDFLSNASDQVVAAARILQKSDRRQRLFRAICSSKRRFHRVRDLARKLNMDERTVLTVGKQLANALLIEQVKDPEGRVAYRKIPVLASRRDQILALAENHRRLEAVATKVKPAIRAIQTVSASVPLDRVRAERITLDDLDDLRRAHRAASIVDPRTVAERTMKRGIQRLFGETGVFRDWGGEGNDLFTTQARIRGRRRALAVALKGPGTTGVLTLAKLGKNGDQIVSLYQSPADAYVLQYCGQVHESVQKEMQVHAAIRSVYERRTIFYGVLSGDDTARVLTAYAAEFR